MARNHVRNRNRPSPFAGVNDYMAKKTVQTTVQKPMEKLTLTRREIAELALTMFQDGATENLIRGFKCGHGEKETVLAKLETFVPHSLEGKIQQRPCSLGLPKPAIG